MVAAASTCGTKKQLQGAWGDSRRLWGEARSRGLWRAHTTSWWEEAFLKWSRETGRKGWWSRGAGGTMVRPEIQQWQDGNGVGVWPSRWRQGCCWVGLIPSPPLQGLGSTAEKSWQAVLWTRCPATQLPWLSIERMSKTENGSLSGLSLLKRLLWSVLPRFYM